MKKAKSFVCFLVCLSTVAGLSLAGCKKDGIPAEEITVYMPDGAPALALAGVMHEDKADDGVTYRVVDAAQIAATTMNKDKEQNADLCVMPVNAAAKLHGEGGAYTMLGGVTHGNLYMIAKSGGESEGFAYTAENLSLLVGKTVGVLQINNVPGLTFKAVLNKYGVAWQELTNTGSAAADKVNLVALPDASAVTSMSADCFVIAEPAATAQARNGFSIVGDLQSLYGGENGYPQAVLIAKTELVETRGAWLREFTQKVSVSAAWLTTASGNEIVTAVNAHMNDSDMVSSLKAPLLTADVLGRCGVRFAYAADIADQTQAFLGDLITVNAQATKLPTAAFFWAYTP
ncbi:MAG: hypothetical protein IJY21_03080 [Clostridia bacterium]|nr:hypothetical protein [Clostridia bacterium]